MGPKAINSAIHKATGLFAIVQNSLETVLYDSLFSVPQELYQAKLGSCEAGRLVNGAVIVHRQPLEE